jgi:hypothetical protein
MQSSCGGGVAVRPRLPGARYGLPCPVPGCYSCGQLAGVCVCFITAGPITKLFAWGEEESGGHVL